MFDVLPDINWLAVLIAVVVSSVIGGLYFAVIIAKPYLVALGKDDGPAPERTPVDNFGSIVCTVLTTITSAALIEALDITSTDDAFVFGLIVGIGYLAAMTFQIAINPAFPRPLYYGLLNAPFFVVTSVVTSLIYVAIS